MIYVGFRKKHDEKNCRSIKNAVRYYGPDQGKELIKLITAIECAQNLLDIKALPQYRLHQLKGNYKDMYSLSIPRSGIRIVFYPQDKEGNTIRSKEDEKEMMKKTEKILIWEITDHYE